MDEFHKHNGKEAKKKQKQMPKLQSVWFHLQRVPNVYTFVYTF